MMKILIFTIVLFLQLGLSTKKTTTQNFGTSNSNSNSRLLDYNELSTTNLPTQNEFTHTYNETEIIFDDENDESTPKNKKQNDPTNMNSFENFSRTDSNVLNDFSSSDFLYPPQDRFENSLDFLSPTNHQDNLPKKHLDYSEADISTIDNTSFLETPIHFHNPSGASFGRSFSDAQTSSFEFPKNPLRRPMEDILPQNSFEENSTLNPPHAFRNPFEKSPFHPHSSLNFGRSVSDAQMWNKRPTQNSFEENSTLNPRQPFNPMEMPRIGHATLRRPTFYGSIYDDSDGKDYEELQKLKRSNAKKENNSFSTMNMPNIHGMNMPINHSFSTGMMTGEKFRPMSNPYVKNDKESDDSSFDFTPSSLFESFKSNFENGSFNPSPWHSAGENNLLRAPSTSFHSYVQAMSNHIPMANQNPMDVVQEEISNPNPNLNVQGMLNENSLNVQQNILNSFPLPSTMENVLHVSPLTELTTKQEYLPKLNEMILALENFESESGEEIEEGTKMKISKIYENSILVTPESELGAKLKISKENYHKIEAYDQNKVKNKLTEILEKNGYRNGGEQIELDRAQKFLRYLFSAEIQEIKSAVAKKCIQNAPLPQFAKFNNEEEPKCYSRLNSWERTQLKLLIGDEISNSPELTKKILDNIQLETCQILSTKKCKKMIDWHLSGNGVYNILMKNEEDQYRFNAWVEEFASPKRSNFDEVLEKITNLEFNEPEVGRMEQGKLKKMLDLHFEKEKSVAVPEQMKNLFNNSIVAQEMVHGDTLAEHFYFQKLIQFYWKMNDLEEVPGLNSLKSVLLGRYLKFYLLGLKFKIENNINKIRI